MVTRAKDFDAKVVNFLVSSAQQLGTTATCTTLLFWLLHSRAALVHVPRAWYMLAQVPVEGYYVEHAALPDLLLHGLTWHVCPALPFRSHTTGPMPTQMARLTTIATK
eukprot:GHUV01028425.1.p2 GENE.GHUV01028425.1~~GHUV01028425.1.p2  ORF type:complete len:108 (+),score=18.55 GHUV01028425.1:697-1020(+)